MIKDAVAFPLFSILMNILLAKIFSPSSFLTILFVQIFSIAVANIA